MFQLPAAARLAIDTELVPMVPTLIRNMWISGELLDPAPTTAYSSRADREFYSRQQQTAPDFEA